MRSSPTVGIIRRLPVLFRLILAVVVGVAALVRTSFATPDLSVWAIGGSSKILWDGTLATTTPPLNYKEANRVWNAATRTISLAAAKGETVDVQIAIEAVGGGDITGVDVAVSSLSGPGGTIPGSNLTLFFEHYILSPYDASLELRPGGALPRGYYPDALVPFYNPEQPSQRLVDPFPIYDTEPNSPHTQPVWLDVAVPTTTVPGDYTGTVTVTGTSVAPVALTLNLTVANATMPATQDVMMTSAIKASSFADIYGFGSFSLANGNFGQYWTRVLKFIAAAEDHRVKLNFNTLVPPIVESPPGSGNIASIDWSAYDTYLGSYLDENGVPVGWQLPSPGVDRSGVTMSAHDVAFWTDFAPAIIDHYNENEWPIDNSFVWVLDEPNGQPDGTDDYPVVEEFGELIDTVAPNLKFAVTEGMHEGLLFDSVDWWIQPGRDYDPVRTDERKALGERAWFYQYTNGEPMQGLHSINTDGLAFRTWPWIAYKYDVEGMYYWAATYWESDGPSPYVVPDDNPADLGEGSGVLFYPGSVLTGASFTYPYAFAANYDGPIPSIRLKNIRRGMQDEALFEQLANLGSAASVTAEVDGLITSALCLYPDPVTHICPGTRADSRYPELNQWVKNSELWDAAVGRLRTELTNYSSPALAPVTNYTIYEQDVLTINLSAADLDPGDSLTFDVTSEPSGATLTDHGDRTATFTWQPTTEQANVYENIVFSVTDGSATDSEPITITVNDGIAGCVPDWSCIDWSTCVDSLQFRSCSDRNGCGTDAGKPAESQTCDSTPPGSIIDLGTS